MHFNQCSMKYGSVGNFQPHILGNELSNVSVAEFTLTNTATYRVTYIGHDQSHAYGKFMMLNMLVNYRQ